MLYIQYEIFKNDHVTPARIHIREIKCTIQEFDMCRIKHAGKQ